jgi:hypothetical protein
LRWLFSSFVADVLLRFRRHPETPPSVIVRTCFNAWRALFAGGDRRLNIKQLAGLFGELYVLERILDRSLTGVRSWKGPLSEPHDFISPGLDVEVKTTLSSEDDVVHVHGIAQLSPPVDGRLCLAHLRVEVPCADGVSIPERVAHLRERDVTGKLTALLESSGYHEEHRMSYSDLTFKVVDERWFEVDDLFPRLTAESFPGGRIPTGLAEFRYTLDLATVTRLPLVESVVEQVLDNFAA